MSEPVRAVAGKPAAPLGSAPGHPLLSWLSSPDAERGIRFAGTGDEWRFCSYDQLAARTRGQARQLHDSGVRPGSAVAVVHGNSPEFVAAFFGCLLLGCTPAPVAPPARFQGTAQYREHLSRIVRLSRADAVATTAGLAPLVAPAAAASGIPVVVAEPDAKLPEWTGDQVPPGIALLQFSSGTTGPSRGVRVPLAALEANIATILSWTNGQAETDAVASWVPVYHDMGLIGCLLAPVSRNADIWLMEPEQFVRTPLRWLRCFSEQGASMSAVPNFGLRHVLRRVRPRLLDGMDFSGWRTLIVGAERVEASTVAGFTSLLEPHGFSATSVMPAYGLAEATLAVTGSRRGDDVTEIAVRPGSLVPGNAVGVHARDAESIKLVGCGRPFDGISVEVIDEEGKALGEGFLGEIEVRGPSIAHGYLSPADNAERLLHGVLRTGDAGFLLNGELFVVGRIGDSVKVRGKWLFAEDVDDVLTRVGSRPDRYVTLLGSLDSRETVVVLAESGAGADGQAVGTALASHVSDLPVLVLEVPGGQVLRTTSGKPRRRAMWERLIAGELAARVLWESAAADSGKPKIPAIDGETKAG